LSYKRRLVIDTSVLVMASGGQDGIVPTSRNCRNVLESVLRICHKAVVSEALNIEWENHRSKYIVQWRSAMQKRGKVIRIVATERPSLRQLILDEHIQSASHQEAAKKDFHLIEAAIETDWIVLSLDDTIRGIFAVCCDRDDHLASVIWVHPDDGTVLGWLEDGAMPDDDKRLAKYEPK